jgi:copper(I)-binding protein
VKTAPVVGSLFLCLLAGCSTDTAPAPAATDAWIRAAPPTATMHAGYLTITNPTFSDLTVIGARSPDFDRIEIHRTVISEGVARMRSEREVPVPARGHVVFEPGGRHLMLFGARRTLARGDKVQLTLELAGTAPLTVTAEVADGPPSETERR